MSPSVINWAASSPEPAYRVSTSMPVSLVNFSISGATRFSLRPEYTTILSAESASSDPDPHAPRVSAAAAATVATTATDRTELTLDMSDTSDLLSALISTNG